MLDTGWLSLRKKRTCWWVKTRVVVDSITMIYKKIYIVSLHTNYIK